MTGFFATNSRWIFEPETYLVSEDRVELVTQPGTDFWQRTYYGFCNNNAPALLRTISEKYFSFTVRTEFVTVNQFDQCGVIIYQDAQNWFKGSSEYENPDFQRLGSVVTNLGYSDWATVDISAELTTIWYRVSRRELDFCLESSTDGVVFKQMRIFHLFEAKNDVNLGLYACSPGQSSFTARFSEFELSECVWTEHRG